MSAGRTQEGMTFSRAFWRGTLCRCPSCGKGGLFSGFLKVRDRCDQCGQELRHHQADDLPAYIVMFFVGALVVPALVAVVVLTDLSYWVQMAIFLPATAILCIGLLPPVKGQVVAIQWYFGMHGFGAAEG
ncbi:MAG: DUF983 domain-containing protein [Magnetospiraceae bacterium]